MAVYDGFTKPSEIELNTFKIWIQIHDLPDGYKPMLEALAAKVGKVITVETTLGDFSGNFYRVRIWCDVRKQLKNAVSLIRAGKRQLFLVKYERLPDWCSFCGMIGHLDTEHGDGVHPPSSLVFKDVRAAWSIRNSGRGRGRGRGIGRGTGFGARDNQMDEEYDMHNAEEGTEYDPDLMAVDNSLKRSLNDQSAIRSDGVPPAADVNALVNQFQIANSSTQIPPSPPPKRDPKRNKTVTKVLGSKDVVVAQNLKLAGSPVERRQEQ
jgi:hypothetical protein